jgi:SAM-dependent methyltransferase
MISYENRLSSHAQHWGALWGSRPAHWATSEAQQTPVYEAALARAPVGPGDRVLDVGCGTGTFLRLCADRGATTSGIDAAEGLLALARARVPEADLRHGDMLALPFADNSFDLVTGFTSFSSPRTWSRRSRRLRASRGRARRSSSRSSGGPSAATWRR